MRRRTLLGGLAAAGVGAAALPLLLRQPDESSGPGFKLLLAGDIHFGENYASSGRRIARRYGYDHSFENLRALIGRADYVVANMETPATDLPQRTVEGRRFLHQTSATEAPAALKRNGIRAVSLANNHAMDYGAQGLNDTLESLHRHGLATFGAGQRLEDAAKPLLLRLPSDGGRPRHLAIFGMFEYRPEYDAQYDFYATGATGGVATIDVERFRQLVRRYREQFEDLYVIAFPHWGKNYAWRVRSQIALGRGLIDAGADLVVGHHGHNFQEVERYQGKWILYGIGNFIFNSAGRFAEFDGVPPYGLAVELDFPRSGTGNKIARLYPIMSDNERTNFQPAIPEAQEAERSIRHLLSRSGISASRSALEIAADPLGAHLSLSL